MSYVVGGAIKVEAANVSIIADLNIAGVAATDLVLLVRRHLSNSQITSTSYNLTELQGDWNAMWSSLTAKETNVAGQYRVCLPNGTFGANADKVDVTVMYTDGDGNVFRYNESFLIDDRIPESGASTLEVRLRANSAPVIGLLVTIRNTYDPVNLYQIGVTDNSGNVTFAVLNGNYDVLIDTGYQFQTHTPDNVDVNNNGAVITINLTPISISPVVPQDLCRISAWVIGDDGVPKKGVALQASLQMAGSGEYNDKLIKKVVVSDVTDTNGYVEIYVLRSDVIEAHDLEDTTDYLITVSQCDVSLLRQVADSEIDLGVLLPV